MLRNINEEVVDLVVYTCTMGEQLRERFPEAYAFLMGEEEIAPDIPQRLRPRIYVAGKYSDGNGNNWHTEKNIALAATCARKIWAMGGSALCPHKNTERFDGPDLPWEAFMEGDFEWISVSDAVYMVGGWQESKGAKLEKAHAEQKQIPVFENLVTLEHWIQEWNN